VASPAVQRSLPAFAPLRRTRLFPGWWIVGAGVCIEALIHALFMQAYGAYTVLLRQDFGWSKTMLSSAFSLGQAEGGLIGPFQGMLVARWGPAAMSRVGAILFGLGLMLLSFVNSPAMFFLAVFVTFTGVNFFGWFPVTVAIVNWFERKRARALAIYAMGVSVGGLIVPVTILSLESVGWRETAFVSGIIAIVLGYPLAGLLMSRAEDYGYQVDGASAPLREAVGTDEVSPRPVAGVRDFTTREAMRTPQFWFIAGGHATALLMVSAVMVHLVPLINESKGYSLAQASLAVAVLTFAQAGGNLLGGVIGDRYSKRVIAAVCMFLHSIGLLMLAFGGGLLILLAAVVIHGIAWGTRGPLMMAIRADYFGRTNFSAIAGASQPIVMAGMTGGPLVAGFLYDRTGDYEAALIVLAILAALGSLFWVFASRPHPPTEPASPAVHPA